MKDLHSALKTEVISKTEGNGAEFALVRLQYGRDDIAYSLHVRPTTFTSSGLQSKDLLAFAGFSPSRCAFLSDECHVRKVGAEFDLTAFSVAFGEACSAIQSAERHLSACGVYLGRSNTWSDGSSGNGHTAPSHESMKRSEDEVFVFAFSWIKTESEKGWVTHYRPKHQPFSDEIRSALHFLKLRTFDECPEFDFEPCHWRFIPYEEQGRTIFSGNADVAHRCFDAHTEHFSPGIQQLLLADATLRPFGAAILPKTPSVAERRILAPSQSRAPVTRRVVSDHEYDVAISFAGSDRPFAARLATILRDAGIRVFYDEFYPEVLWGKDLALYFSEIYRKRSRYCVIFASQQYAERAWTTHELRSAAARAIEEKGAEYILPIRVDATEIPGLLPTTGYLELERFGVEKIAEILVLKLQAEAPAK